jgi:hypothetical protein
MWRYLVLFLVLLNGAYYLWSQGQLQVIGLAPERQTEPERLAQQIKPSALRLLSPDEFKRLTSPPPVGLRASECLQAGLFNQAQAEALRSSLTGNPGVGTWTLDAATTQARWIVYMGKYANADELVKKKTQLAAMSLKVESLVNQDLEIGLSLGNYPSQAEAVTALEGLNKRGVRTARVVLERAALPGWVLQLKTGETTLQAQLDALKPALAGKPLTPCSLAP